MPLKCKEVIMKKLLFTLILGLGFSLSHSGDSFVEIEADPFAILGTDFTQLPDNYNHQKWKLHLRTMSHLSRLILLLKNISDAFNSSKCDYYTNFSIRDLKEPKTPHELYQIEFNEKEIEKIRTAIMALDEYINDALKKIDQKYINHLHEWYQDPLSPIIISYYDQYLNKEQPKSNYFLAPDRLIQELLRKYQQHNLDEFIDNINHNADSLKEVLDDVNTRDARISNIKQKEAIEEAEHKKIEDQIERRLLEFQQSIKHRGEWAPSKDPSDDRSSYKIGQELLKNALTANAEE